MPKISGSLRRLLDSNSLLTGQVSSFISVSSSENGDNNNFLKGQINSISFFIFDCAGSLLMHRGFL